LEQLPGPVAFALLGSAGIFARGPRAPLVIGVVGFFLAGLIGVAFTLRFFTHDDAQLLPALAIVAVRPQGLVAALLDLLTPFRRVALFAPAVLGIGAGWPDYRQRRDYARFMGGRDHMVQAICQKVAPVLPPNEPVLAWGWHGWSVYEHCQRPAPGRIFKVLAHVTTLNTNTCNKGFGPMTLRSGPGPKILLDEVRRRPPSLFLWTNYFDEMGDDPLRHFTELHDFIERRYEIVAVRGPFVAMLRTDLVSPERVTTASPARRYSVGPGLFSSLRSGDEYVRTRAVRSPEAPVVSNTECPVGHRHASMTQFLSSMGQSRVRTVSELGRP
jgi:hypothetical protein